MSETVTHTAVLDDCFRLMMASDEICDTFKEIGRDLWDFAQLGCITRSGDRFTVKLLTSFRERWDARKPGDKLEPKLAYVLGWLAHRAADRQMKPVFREADPNSGQSPTDCSIYHDAFLYREIYACGKEKPYNPSTLEVNMESLPGAQGIDLPAAETFFRTLMQRTLLAMHTFIPARDDIEPWLENVFNLQQRFYVGIERYADAVYRPDPDKIRRFIAETNFYDPADPIIVAVRRLHRKEAVTPAQVREAAEAGAASHYAQAVKMGFGYIRAASEFFTGDMTPEDLKPRLDIGKPGRDGKSV